ncbi:hypothetical protein QCE63_19410 [Caballeronia sp. LZ065]|nr:hypothetical protein [Caballeronia sp. LZ065]
MLIVPGPGSTDRDGNNPFGVQAATYRLLAEGLFDRGIASVRIDKRGMYGSASAMPDADDVTSTITRKTSKVKALVRCGDESI